MRVVIDTNQLIAALLRPPELATFLLAWESARFVPVASPELIDEYLRVIAYPDIADLVYPELQRAVDADGDGVCDNLGTQVPLRDGTGSQNGASNVQRGGMGDSGNQV